MKKRICTPEPGEDLLDHTKHSHVPGGSATETATIEDRWFVVLLADGTPPAVLSRRRPSPTHPFGGEWGMLTEAEATHLASAAGPNAQVVECFRFEDDPVWTEDLA